MTVNELIRALEEHLGHAQVLTQGCDCWGDVARVAVVTSTAYAGPHVILVRSAEPFGDEGMYA